jgi:secreted trypsin-like serine protease
MPSNEDIGVRSPAPYVSILCCLQRRPEFLRERLSGFAGLGHSGKSIDAETNFECLSHGHAKVAGIKFALPWCEPLPTKEDTMKSRVTLFALFFACGAVNVGELSPLDGVQSADDYDSEAQDIVNGSAARPGEFPFMTPLFTQRRGKSGLYDSFRCGGMLIEPDLVLTAAHCVENLDWTKLKVGYGSLFLSALPKGKDGFLDASAKNVATIKGYWKHPGYMEFTKGQELLTLDNDVALVRLSKPFVNGSLVDYVHSPVGEPGPGTAVVAAGWGVTDREGTLLADELRRAVIPLVSRAQCQRAFDELDAYGVEITGQMTCAGGGFTSPCFGDSGGPLLARLKNGARRVVGVTSFGVVSKDPNEPVCAIRRAPGVFARTATLAPWLDACRANPAACVGEGKSSECRITGVCSKDNKDIHLRLGEKFQTKEACLSQADDYFKNCGNSLDDDHHFVTADFVTAAGTETRYITGVAPSKP